MSDRPERNNQASHIDEAERARVLMLQDSVYQPARYNQSKPAEPVKEPAGAESMPARGADGLAGRSAPQQNSEQSTSKPSEPQQSDSRSKQIKYLPALEIK